MKIDIKKIRESYGLNPKDFASIIGLKPNFYVQYETRKELPSKYVYLLWQNLDDFPVPDDFFVYTSFTLLVNMHYHNLTQSAVAKMFDIANQSTISGYLKNNIPMYEKKKYFSKFKPLIVPYEMKMVKDEDGKHKEIAELRDLTAKGNFILAEIRKTNKANKLKQEE